MKKSFTCIEIGVVLLGLALSGACRPRTKNSSALQSFTDAHAVAPHQLNGVPVVGEIALTSNRNVIGGLPVGGAAFDETSTLIVSRPQFVVAFNTVAKVPRWTTWQIKESDIGDIERENQFQSDDILNKYLELKNHEIGVTPSEYKHSCFDRGHQSPAKDRSNSQQDSRATFYMSNMAPQTAFLNRGIWGKFEAYTRTLAQAQHKRLQVIAGPILRDGREGIGSKGDIAVPDSFFKIVIVYADGESQTPESYVAVIMPNVTADGLDPLSNRAQNCKESKGARSGSMASDWETYQVTIADIQTRTGMKFPAIAGVAKL